MKSKKRSTKKNKSKRTSKTNPLQILIRYLILLALMFTLPLIYKIFTPLTIYPTAYLLKLFYNISTQGSTIILNNQTLIQIIPACIAGSAYLLLLIINLSLPMPFKKRIYTLSASFAILLAVNILRIFIFSIWYHTSTPFFEFTHTLFWYVLSIVIVIGIWFLIVKTFSIKEIPVYTDLKVFLKEIKKN